MRGFSEQLHAAAKKTTPGFETTSTCDVGVRLNYMKQVGPALLQVIHIKNKMQETVGVVSSASALVIPPFCKLSQPYFLGWVPLAGGHLRCWGRVRALPHY